MHPADAPPIRGGYKKIISIVSIHEFYEWTTVQWKALVCNKEALSPGGLQPTVLDISLILRQPEAKIPSYQQLLTIAFIDNNLILWSI
jgi:hypothetical protein